MSRVAVICCALALIVLAAGCAIEDSASGPRFEPAQRDTLTVATAFLDAPGFWERDGGFEAALARALADRLGLARVAIKQVPFADLAAGRLNGADLALSQLSPTDQRETSLDFTTPYLLAPAGVLVRAGTRPEVDVKGLRTLRWVTSRVSTLTPIVDREIRPTTTPVEVTDRAQALLLDQPVALGLAHDDPAHFGVLAQLPNT